MKKTNAVPYNIVVMFLLLMVGSLTAVSQNSYIQFPCYTTNGNSESSIWAILGTSDFTLLATVIPTNNTYGIIFSKERSGVIENQFRLEFNSDGSISFRGLGFEMSPIEYKTPLPLNSATNVAVARKRSNVFIYIDSVEVASGVMQPVYDHNNTLNFRVGSMYPNNQTSSSIQDVFSGQIQNAQLHMTALVAAQIAAAYLYNPCSLPPSCTSSSTVPFDEENPFWNTERMIAAIGASSTAGIIVLGCLVFTAIAVRKKDQKEQNDAKHLPLLHG